MVPPELNTAGVNCTPANDAKRTCKILTRSGISQHVPGTPFGEPAAAHVAVPMNVQFDGDAEIEALVLTKDDDRHRIAAKEENRKTWLAIVACSMV